MEVRTFWCLLYEKKAEPVKGSAFFCIMYGDGGSLLYYIYIFLKWWKNVDK